MITLKLSNSSYVDEEWLITFQKFLNFAIKTLKENNW